MAAKKAKSKKAKSKKKKAAARGPAVHKVVIFCDGGCTAAPDELHVYFGDVVVFVADGTKAKAKFGSKSPFGTGTFNIPKDGFKAAQIDKRTGEFDYTVECTACAVPALPPRIIID